MDSLFEQKYIGTYLFKTNLDRSQHIAKWVSENDHQVCGLVKNRTVVLFGLTGDSNPTNRITLHFNDDIRNVSVHSSAKYIAVALEEKKFYVINLEDLQVSSEPQANRINGYLISYEIVTSKKVTTLQWTDKYNLLYSDKFGNIFEIQLSETASGLSPSQKNPSLPLGHYSVITSVTFVSPLNASEGRQNRYIVTSDRDEKIRVSRWPHAYDITAYCLGHSQFISCVSPVQNSELNLDLLVSGGGDSKIFGWDYTSGRVLFQSDITKFVQVSSLTKQLQTNFQSVGLVPSNLLYFEAHNLLVLSVEFCDALFYFNVAKNQDNLTLTFVKQQNIPLIPIKMMKDGDRLWIAGISNPQNDSNSVHGDQSIQVLTFSEQNKQFETDNEVSHKINSVSNLDENHQFNSTQLKKTFVSNLLEENLRKHTNRRGGNPHSGSASLEGEPAFKKIITE